jgi:hypothetical protein
LSERHDIRGHAGTRENSNRRQSVDVNVLITLSVGGNVNNPPADTTTIKHDSNARAETKT